MPSPASTPPTPTAGTTLKYVIHTYDFAVYDAQGTKTTLTAAEKPK